MWLPVGFCVQTLETTALILEVQKTLGKPSVLKLVMLCSWKAKLAFLCLIQAIKSSEISKMAF